VVTANAVVVQRRNELDLTEKVRRRSEDLVTKGFVSAEKLDVDRAQWLVSKAALDAARSQVAESEAAVQASIATIERIESDIDDSVLKAPVAGRVQYRLAEPSEVLAAGGKVVSVLDLSDVYMVVFLTETSAGQVRIGAEARLVLDAAPDYVIPATVRFVADQAQFTPKTVETSTERQKLVFRVKVQLDPDQLRHYSTQIKAGLPGLAYVRIDPRAQWPEALAVRLPPQ
jgi:HlyD family secretion protein